VAALGAVEPPLLSQVSATLRAVTGCEVGRLPELARPAYAFNKDRAQFHVAAILRRLAALRGKEAAVPVLGVTDADLFVPDAPFVFGESDRSELAAVVSVARLRGEPPVEAELLLRRISAEAMHQLGHLIGLLHCQDARCAMFQAQRVADVDRKRPGLCGTCRTAAGLTE
jgi:archaemetzincin